MHTKTRQPDANKAARPPGRTLARAWARHKGTVVWASLTACGCVAVAVVFQWVDGGDVIGIALAVSAAIVSIILKLATPYLKARSGDKRIAMIKAMQGPAVVPGPPAAGGLIGAPPPRPVDTGQLKAAEGFALMHMGPPEVIDLDLSRQRGSRGRAAGAGLVEQKEKAVAKAMELEDRGALDKAIAEYKKALALSRQLGLDDEAISFENRIQQLEREKEEGWAGGR
ncbi:MAG: hypothetical protein JW839_19775 [Candidatus Lokiarchaeota archaeon]|nr:hypothetical protein [Candidatus Lokiarchaeota archaeon]